MRSGVLAEAVVLAAACLALAGCGDEGGELRDATRMREAATSGAGDSAPPPMTVDTADPQIPVFTDPALTGAAVTPAADTVAARADSAAPAQPGAPAAPQEWTAGTRDVNRPPSPPSRVVDLRTARNEGFDRVVIQIEGARVPGYRVEYVDRPVRACGSGEATEIAGEGWLAIRLNGAAAHDDQGRATVRERERKLSLPVMRELEITCDFEGEVTVVVGVARPNKYRVIELANPTRLVVDVQHQ